MGLGFCIMRADHDTCEAHWSYFGFQAFRLRLARQLFGAGIVGLWHDKPETFQQHPLNALLDHGDCDGQLSYEQCKVIAPALREAVKDWGEKDPLDYDCSNAIRLAEAMESMGDCDVLEFC